MVSDDLENTTELEMGSSDPLNRKRDKKSFGVYVRNPSCYWLESDSQRVRLAISIAKNQVSIMLI